MVSKSWTWTIGTEGTFLLVSWGLPVSSQVRGHMAQGPGLFCLWARGHFSYLWSKHEALLPIPGVQLKTSHLIRSKGKSMPLKRACWPGVVTVEGLRWAWSQSGLRVNSRGLLRPPRVCPPEGWAGSGDPRGKRPAVRGPSAHTVPTNSTLPASPQGRARWNAAWGAWWRGRKEADSPRHHHPLRKVLLSPAFAPSFFMQVSAPRFA